MTKPSPSAGRTLLLVGLLCALAFTGFHVFRTVNDAIYWRHHKDEPIAGWMTLGYVAHSYHLPPHVLFMALGMPPGPPEKRNLAAIAASRGQNVDDVVAILNRAIVHSRPPYPPPGPPPPGTVKGQPR